MYRLCTYVFCTSTYRAVFSASTVAVLAKLTCNHDKAKETQLECYQDNATLWSTHRLSFQSRGVKLDRERAAL